MSKQRLFDIFAAIPAGIAVIWLILASNWQSLDAALPVLAVSLVLHLAFRWLTLSDLFSGALANVPGSHGRFVTWAAVLLVGPVALWIDLLGASVQIIYAWSTRRYSKLNWRVLQPLLTTLTRDTLVGLVALSFVGVWGQGVVFVPLADLGIVPILWLLAVRVLGTGIVSLLLFWVHGYGRFDSLIDRGQQIFRLARATLIFLILPEPFAILAASMFELLGSWGMVLFWTGIFLLAYLAHWLQKTAVSTKHRAKILYQLKQLAEEMLHEPAEDVDLPRLLAAYVPTIFADGWVEIRQLPDTVLFAQAEGWIPAPNEIWSQLAAYRGELLLLPAMPEAVEAGYGPDAMLIPIWQEAELVCGIYLIRQATGDIRQWEESALALASQISAGLYRRIQFQKALDSQAAAYEEAVYQQAYQAEVYAQALAYEKVSQELAVAGKIQSTFLPQELPTITGWQLAVTLEPARETSGDFYDFIPLPNGRLGLIVADVADKGMGAALYMALSRTLIRTYATQYAHAPEKALAAANGRILQDTTSDLFATVFYGILDPETGVLTYCNAGHNPPYLQSPNGETSQLLKRTALPIGIFADMPWEQAQVIIKPGELLVMYTDGVVEAEDEVEDSFGETRLQSVTKANINRSPEVIENKVITAVFDFAGDAPQLDDITLMLLKRESS